MKKPTEALLSNPILEVDNIAFSQRKLQSVADSLAVWIASQNCRQHPCESELDCVGYRSRCNFQCVWNTEGDGEGRKGSTSNVFHYAIRREGAPVVVDNFPVANRRIQKAMEELRVKLNLNTSDYDVIRQYLTSFSFSTSWKDIELDGECCTNTDCFVTLHYDKVIQDPVQWKDVALRICNELGFSQMSGRSRKCFLRARDESTGEGVYIRDTLWLTRSTTQIGHGLDWAVSLLAPQSQELESVRTVQYKKTEDAFFHPNARAMCRALEWLLCRLEHIQQKTSLRTGVNMHQQTRPRLLELYCGCGAHTMVLWQTDLLSSIVAVELDDRLVDACRRNFELNQNASHISTTVLDIISADAGIWATTGESGSSNGGFDILLVDPPRQGLDAQVCRMALIGRFEHILYISCGHQALKRDLAILSKHFDVVDCTLLDLFPQTEAVESLVHLQRRNDPKFL